MSIVQILGNLSSAAFDAVSGAVKSVIVDIDGTPTEFDTVASDGPYGYPVVVSTEHHKIHEGAHYVADVCDLDVDIALPKQILVRAPDTAVRAHLTVSVVTSVAATIKLYEGPTISADGTQATAYNNDRNSVSTPTVNIYNDPTVTATGTDLMIDQCVGSPGIAFQAQGGNLDRSHEIILRQGEDYLLVVGVDANNSRVSCEFNWYEV